MIWPCRLAVPLGVCLLTACPSTSSGDGGTEGDGSGSSSDTSATTTTSTSGPMPTGGTDAATTQVDTTADSTGMPATTTGADACPPTHECLVDAPEGWQGPIAFENGAALDELVECGGGFPEELLASAVDPSAPLADCTCECDANASCDDIIVERCSIPNIFWVAPGGMCENDSSPTTSGVWSAESELTGSCDPVFSKTTVPPEFAAAVRGCAGTPLEVGCEAGQSCLPVPSAPFSGQLCIFADGDLECPNEEFGLKSVFMRSFEDTRECTACTCEALPELCDIPGGVTMFESAGCGVGGGGTASIPVADGSCDPLVFSGSGISTPDSWFAAAPEVPACADGRGGDPRGALTPTDPVTVCCRP